MKHSIGDYSPEYACRRGTYVNFNCMKDTLNKYEVFQSSITFQHTPWRTFPCVTCRSTTVSFIFFTDGSKTRYKLFYVVTYGKFHMSKIHSVDAHVSTVKSYGILQNISSTANVPNEHVFFIVVIDDNVFYSALEEMVNELYLIHCCRCLLVLPNENITLFLP